MKIINLQASRIRPITPIVEKVLGLRPFMPDPKKKGTLIQDATRFFFGRDKAAEICVAKLESLKDETQKKEAIREMFRAQTGTDLSEQVLSRCDQELMRDIMEKLTCEAAYDDTKKQVMLLNSGNTGFIFKRDAKTNELLIDVGVAGFRYLASDYSSDTRIDPTPGEFHFPGEFHLLYRVNEKTGVYTPAAYYFTNPILEELFDQEIFKTAAPEIRAKSKKAELMKWLGVTPSNPIVTHPVQQKSGDMLSKILGKITRPFAKLVNNIKAGVSSLFRARTPAKTPLETTTTPRITFDQKSKSGSTYQGLAGSSVYQMPRCRAPAKIPSKKELESDPKQVKNPLSRVAFAKRKEPVKPALKSQNDQKQMTGAPAR